MKERLKTFMEEMNQSEELKEGQIIELLSCFQDADTEKENQFIMEAEEAVAGILTTERIKMFDQRFISSHMERLLAVAGNVKSCETIGAYQIGQEEEENRFCVLRVIRLKLDDGSVVHVVNVREGML